MKITVDDAYSMSEIMVDCLFLDREFNQTLFDFKVNNDRIRVRGNFDGLMGDKTAEDRLLDEAQREVKANRRRVGSGQNLTSAASGRRGGSDDNRREKFCAPSNSAWDLRPFPPPTLTYVPYWNDPKIHNAGNGRLHAFLARPSTRLIDRLAYGGVASASGSWTRIDPGDTVVDLLRNGCLDRVRRHGRRHFVQ